jgi:hypothetical protein
MATVIINDENSETPQNESTNQPTQEQTTRAIEFGQLLERNRQNEATLLQLQSRLEAAEQSARISAEQSASLQARLDQLLTELETEESEEESDEVTQVSPEPEPVPETPQIPPKRQQSKLAQFLFGDDD